VVLSHSTSETWVDSFDPTTRRFTLGTRVGVVSLTDASGAPISGPASADMSGVTFRRTLDEHRQLIGRVTSEGATQENASMVATTEAAIAAGLSKLPDQPLAIGEHWIDTTSTLVPLGPAQATFVCHIDNVITAVEPTSDGRMASIESRGECAADPVGLATPQGNASMVVDGTFEGVARVSLEDGLAGDSRVETRTRVSTTVGGQSAGTIEIAQLTETHTVRIDDGASPGLAALDRP